MSGIEALEKLREISRARMDGWLKMDVQRTADEIEAEVERDYVRLPVDADGVLIRPGDTLEYDYGDISGKRTVVALIYDGSRRMDFDGGIWDFEFDDDVDGDDTRSVNCMSDFYDCNRHAKPRTLEDVLREMLDRNSDGVGLREFNRDFDAFVAHYADEIRELMEVDA